MTDDLTTIRHLGNEYIRTVATLDSQRDTSLAGIAEEITQIEADRTREMKRLDNLVVSANERRATVLRSHAEMTARASHEALARVLVAARLDERAPEVEAEAEPTPRRPRTPRAEMDRLRAEGKAPPKRERKSGSVSTNVNSQE